MTNDKSLNLLLFNILCIWDIIESGKGMITIILGFLIIMLSSE